MLRALRLKDKASGLRIIAVVGLIQMLLFLELYHSILFKSTVWNWTKIWAISKLPICFLLLWLICFSLVKLTQSKRLKLLFFEDFNIWKGLALLLIWPALMFWKQILTDYHEAFDFGHPFTSLVISHLTILFLCVLFSPLLLLIKNKKTKKSEGTKQWYQNAVPNFLWIRFFFCEVGTDWFGKLISYVVGSGYLLFFYMTLLSLVLPFHVTTAGNTLKAYDVNYILARKYGSTRGTYCVLYVNSDNKILKFALNNCPSCARQPNANVIVTHSPIDYNNRRVSSVVCENK